MTPAMRTQTPVDLASSTQWYSIPLEAVGTAGSASTRYNIPAEVPGVAGSNPRCGVPGQDPGQSLCMLYPGADRNESCRDVHRRRRRMGRICGSTVCLDVLRPRARNREVVVGTFGTIRRTMIQHECRVGNRSMLLRTRIRLRTRGRGGAGKDAPWISGSWL